MRLSDCLTPLALLLLLLLYADDGKLCMPLALFRQMLPILLALFAVVD